MNKTGLNFVYTEKSFHEADSDYWQQVESELKPDFPNVHFKEFSIDSDERFDSIIICSLEEALGDESLSSPRGVIITFKESIEPTEIEKVRAIYGKGLLGFIDSGKPALLHNPWFKRIVLESKVLGTGAQQGLGQVHLGKVLEQSLMELQRVKKLHEKVVPLRQEKVKSVNLFSKFAAGYSSGGEFFDIKKTDTQMLIIVTHAQSYVASSIILSHFEKLQQSKFYNREILEDFLEDLVNECRELDLIDRDEPESLQLDMILLDLKTYHYEGYHFGKGAYFSNGHKLSNENERALNENFFEEAHYEGSLERGQKLIFVSPGVLQNFEVKGEKGLLTKIIKEQFDNGPREVLNEIFFQLKKNTEEDFLKYDASVIYLEVDPNAFMQV